MSISNGYYFTDRTSETPLALPKVVTVTTTYREIGIWEMMACLPKRPRIPSYGSQTLQHTCEKMSQVSGGTESYERGTIARYHCKDGYALSSFHGQEIYRCLSDGQWSPRVPPVCISMDNTNNNGEKRREEKAFL